jgi:two-component system, response regulator
VTALLLVEDNKSDEKLALLAIRRAEVATEVVVARDGQEAIDQLLGAGESDPGCRTLPALVLLDLNLPRIGGLEVLRRLRANERTRHLPIVVLTTSKAAEHVVQSYEFGANGFVVKAVDLNDFIKAMNTLLVFWLVVNQPAPARAAR